MQARSIAKSFLAASGAVCVAAATAHAADVRFPTGDFDLSGKHSKKGTYTGTAKIKKLFAGFVRIEASGTYTATGEKFTWSGDGFVWGQALSFTIKVKSPGIVDVITGSEKKPEKAKGRYTVAADGKSVSGSWALESDKTVGGTDRLRVRGAPVPASGQVSLVVAGKESKEDVVPQRVVSGRDDLIDLRVRKFPNAPAGSTLEVALSGSNVALFKDAALSQPVTSSLPNEDATLKIKGVAPTDPEKPVVVSVRLKGADGKVVAEDRASVHVARSAFLLSGHGDFELGSNLKRRLRDGLAADKRTNPPLVRGKDQKTQKTVFYAVYYFDNDAGAKIALSTPSSVVAYHGHSNFGLGYAFTTGFKRISEFFNIADPQMPVNWQYLREHQEHPDLTIEDAEYGDDSSTPEAYDPVQVPLEVPGTLNTYAKSSFPSSGGEGTRLHLTRGSQKFLDHHYGSEENWRIVVKAGSADMPEKRWSKLLLLSCYSGPYYYKSFGGRGTLFYTWDEALCASEAASIWLEDMMVGKSNDATLKDINKVENVHDYHDFGS